MFKYAQVSGPSACNLSGLIWTTQGDDPRPLTVPPIFFAEISSISAVRRETGEFTRELPLPVTALMEILLVIQRSTFRLPYPLKTSIVLGIGARSCRYVYIKDR